MQKHEYSKIATPLKSIGRIYKERSSQLRPAYQRDRDRVIHSTAFRRLKHKTQVFVNTDVDHYRTRITHSLEVSQIARTFAKIFNLNEDLCETLSLAHDLGHTPFGHAGEEALNDCMKKFGGFDHNIQTLRIVTLLENKYYNFKGLNLTLETLDGLIKHNGPIKNLNLFDKILNKEIFKNKINFNNYPSLEAQAASISDDIAYNNHDLEDGLRAALFDLDKLKSIPLLSKIINTHKKKINNFRKEIIINQIIREIINLMVLDVIRTTNINLKKIKPRSIKDIYSNKQFIVDFSDEMKKTIKLIKTFLKKNMYNHKQVLVNTNNGKKIVRNLFHYFVNNQKKYMGDEFFKNKPIERAISDFIAGMTDRYAINIHDKIK